MVKFLKQGKAVILLQGRYTGKKAVIVRVFEEGTRDRPYEHCLVADLAKYPNKVIRKDSAEKTANNARIKVFLKLVNFTHLMPTRYTLDIDLKEVVSGAPDSLTTKTRSSPPPSPPRPSSRRGSRSARTGGSSPSSA
ncbi:60S ribosomal protein L27-3 [Hordeum vulgare]|nr:60S ribosomal protein L27-3 [Hordeum vulgare]